MCVLLLYSELYFLSLTIKYFISPYALLICLFFCYLQYWQDLSRVRFLKSQVPCRSPSILTVKSSLLRSRLRMVYVFRIPNTMSNFWQKLTGIFYSSSYFIKLKFGPCSRYIFVGAGKFYQGKIKLSPLCTLTFLLQDTFIMHQGSMKRESSLMPMSFLSASSWASTCWTWKVEQELAALSISILQEVPKGKKEILSE